ncbi:MAG: NADH-quinone oxidoreductase subunit C [Candidatus Aminicenantes bacterium]|nr:NADH-quinone oxidoreductase subunit C [Candidatus Aminicenantes bacterium]
MPEDIAAALASRFGESVSDLILGERSILFKAEKDAFHEALSLLKTLGFEHLSDVSVVDYMSEGEFEVVYHLWSHARKERATQKVRIPRESPAIDSVVDLWPGAQIHEREAHELFGIRFEGNPDLSPLFLEDWKEIPPFRKDFDTRAYVKKRYEADE